MNRRETEGAPAEAFPPVGRLWRAAGLLSLGLLLMAVAAAAAQAPAIAARSSLESLPPFFEANRGQADARFPFIARGQDHAVHLAPEQVVVTLAVDEGKPARQLGLTIVGADPRARALGLDALAGTVNYFIGNDPAQWHTRVPTFERVRFDAVLPGIDMVYYSTGRRLEYDFLVAPGADPRAIRLRVEGADALRLEPEGDLILEAGGDRILQHRPVAYQTVAGARRPVSVRYVLKGSNLSFALGAYDTSLPLVIDPILSYSTYLGGKGQQNGWSIAVAASGSVIVAGETLAALTPLPVTGFQTNFAGGTSTSGDAFVARLNASGTAFDYITYLGGRSLDGAVSVSANEFGGAVVAGYTTSRDFPVTPGGLQPSLSGANVPRTSTPPPDAFVTMLDPTGSFLLYSTYLGGTSFDSAAAVALDSANNAYVVGYTESTNFPVVAAVGSSNCSSAILRSVWVTNDGQGVLIATNLPTECPAQARLAGQSDVFVCKLIAGGSALEYSTYFGGTHDENALGVATDGLGDVFVTGWTVSTDFPVTSGAFQPVLGGKRDAFVLRFDDQGALVYSTYLGGVQDDLGYKIAANSDGEAFVTGGKSSPEFPTTPGAFNRGGVFRSADGAALWNGAGLGLPHTVVEALTRLPGGDLFAGTPRGVFRSADAGATWSASLPSLTVGGINALAHDGTGTNLYAGSGKGVLLSTNAGAGWSFANSGLGERVVLALAHAPNELLAGTRGGGVFRSTNNAAKWKAANAGLGNLNVNAFATHPLNDAIVFAATDNGVFRSTNHGVNWRAAQTGLTTKKTQSLAIDPVTPSTLYAGTTRGVFSSADYGSNWVIRSVGLGNSNVLSLAVDPLASTTLYAGTTNGLFKSTDAGATWTTNSTGLAPLSVKALLLDPLSPSTLYAGVRGSNSFGGSNDVFLTKLLPNGGLAWSLALGGKKNDEGYSVAVDSAGRAFVAGSTDSTNFPVVNPPLLLRSTNSGKSDAFLAQFAPDGSEILFSIYLGGKSPDYGYAVAVDNAGAAYVTGRTQSTNFPTLLARQPGFAGKSDAFVVKVIPEVGVAVARNAEHVVVRWPGPMPGYVLEGADSLAGPWTPVAGTPVQMQGWSCVTLPAETTRQFFRLRQAE